MKHITPESIINRLQKESYPLKKLPKKIRMGRTAFFEVFRLFPSYIGSPLILWGIPFEIDWELGKKQFILEFDDDVKQKSE